MQIHLLIGPTGQSTARFRTILKKKRANLEKLGVMSPEWNHIRVYMACSDSDQVGLVRYMRGFGTRDAQEALYKHIASQLAPLTERKDMERLILSSGQLGGLMSRPGELQRLKSLLNTVSDDIRVTAYVGEQAQLMVPYSAEQVMDGRRFSLERELELIETGNWWDGALAITKKASRNTVFSTTYTARPSGWTTPGFITIGKASLAKALSRCARSTWRG